MRVFIANFGQANVMWPECLEHGMIATVDNEGAHPFWEAGDREGYVEYALAHLKTALGETPTRSVASRWFGLMNSIAETNGDIWFHRERDELWWTTSHADPVEIRQIPSHDVKRDGPRLYQLSKRCDRWSDRTRRGTQLSWTGLHPKAKDFLFTEGTLQQLKSENAVYAIALIEGEDLSQWENQAAWKSKAARSGHGGSVTYSARQKSIWEMVETVKATVAKSNGQKEPRTLKNKDLNFTEEELTTYIDKRVSDQGGACALTGLQLQFRGDHEDDAMLCSLDRIDSSGHYAPGNLQVVCRFVNRWKSDSKDEEFRRLLSAVRAVEL